MHHHVLEGILLCVFHLNSTVDHFRWAILYTYSFFLLEYVLGLSFLEWLTGLGIPGPLSMCCHALSRTQCLCTKLLCWQGLKHYLMLCDILAMDSSFPFLLFLHTSFSLFQMWKTCLISIFSRMAYLLSGDNTESKVSVSGDLGGECHLVGVGLRKKSFHSGWCETLRLPMRTSGKFNCWLMPHADNFLLESREHWTQVWLTSQYGIRICLMNKYLASGAFFRRASDADPVGDSVVWIYYHSPCAFPAFHI
jgi:hypothetical protein